MDGNLEFLRTESVEDFKKRQGISKINIEYNPETGKHLFLFAGKIGAVTSKFNPEKGLKDAVVSEVIGRDGKPFHLLHENGSNFEHVVSL
jgi:hypothetical protein